MQQSGDRKLLSAFGHPIPSGTGLRRPVPTCVRRVTSAGSEAHETRNMNCALMPRCGPDTARAMTPHLASYADPYVQLTGDARPGASTGPLRFYVRARSQVVHEVEALL